METRESSKIEGIPYNWETNLTDQEIRFLYAELKKRRLLIVQPLTMDNDGLSIYCEYNDFEIKSDDITIIGTVFETKIYAKKYNKNELEAKRLFEIEEARKKKEQEKDYENLKIQRLKEYEKFNDYYKLAVESFEKRMYEVSTKYFKSCIELNRRYFFRNYNFDKNRSPFAYLFRISALKNDPAIAMDIIDSNNRSLIIDLGVAFEGLGNYDVAEKIYEQLYKSDPKNSHTVFKRYTICLERQKKYIQAINMCDEAISMGILFDGTKGGFEGRKLRLIKKYMNQNNEGVQK